MPIFAVTCLSPAHSASAAGGLWRAVALYGARRGDALGSLGFAIPVVALLLVMLPMFDAELGMIERLPGSP